MSKGNKASGEELFEPPDSVEHPDAYGLGSRGDRNTG